MNYALKIFLKEPYYFFKSRMGRKFLWICFKYGGKRRFLHFRTYLLSNPLYVVDNMSFLWQFHDIFVKEVYRFKSDVEDPVIIDCGSNIGLSVIYFKKLYPKAKIIAFEADPDIYQVQSENLKRFKDIELKNKAVWIDNKGVQLHPNQADGGYVSQEGEVNVKSERLRDVLSSLKKIDLLKLDVEGAEFDLIEDCKEHLSQVEKLFVEIHTFKNEKQKVAGLIKVIEKAGFRYFIENANDQKSPLFNDWRASDTGMDMQLNLYAIRE